LNKKEKDCAKKIINIAQKLIINGFVVDSKGNLSIRLGKRVLITPSNICYNKLNPQDIIIMNLDGQIIEGKLKPSIETLMHLSIYKSNISINAIIHTHSLFASIISIMRWRLKIKNKNLKNKIGESIEVAKYALPGTKTLAKNVSKCLIGKKAVLLANHGVVGVGLDLKEAFMVCRLVENNAKILFERRKMKLNNFLNYLKKYFYDDVFAFIKYPLSEPCIMHKRVILNLIKSFRIM
jgi:L-fuculose-phosphate aldolase